jgi:hypothetical protein
MVGRTNVIYLMKDKFQFYAASYGKIFEFRFVPEVVRDLDIVNKDLLENLIKVFVTNCKIAPGGLVFVLAENAYFSKEIFLSPQQKSSRPDTNRELLKKQADEFIEHVPFENVVSKTVEYKDGLKVYATNQDFYEVVAIAFEHLGFTVESVIPGLVLGNGLSLRPMMDPSMANVILQKISSVSQYNFLHQQVYQPQIKLESEDIDEVELERLQVKKPDKKRVYGLVGLLFSLIIVLIIVFVQSQGQTSSPKQPALANTLKPTVLAPTQVVLATVVPTIEPSISPGTLETQNLTVQIVNAAATATNAQNLEGLLTTYRFKSVSLQTQSPIGSSGSLVSFGPNVSQDVRNIVIAAIKKYESNVIVQDQQVGSYDVSIVLGQ